MLMERFTNYLRGRAGATMQYLKSANFMDIAIILTGLTLAVLIRYPLLSFKSSDFLDSTRKWYVTIKAQGGAVFGTNFSTYSPPYLYLLYLIARFFPDTPILIATKFPSLLTDFICAFFVYCIVNLKYSERLFPMLAAYAVLFAPTVVLNSAFWGQADMLFTAPLVASIYFLVTRKNTLAFIAFGIALSFKLQAVFLMPLLVALFLRREVSWRHFLLLPLIVILSFVPSSLAGRPLPELLDIYLFQARQYPELGLNAPNAYAWIPDTGLTQRFFLPTGVILGVTLSFLFIILVYKSRAKMSIALIVELAMVCAVLLPFFLPEMHERYFFLADVVSIVFAFYSPRFFFVPLVMNLVSFFAYQPILFNATPIPMGILAAGLFVMIAVLVKDMISHLFSAGTEIKGFGETQ